MEGWRDNVRLEEWDKDEKCRNEWERGERWRNR